MFTGVNLNPGTYSIHASGLNDMRSELLKKAAESNNPDGYFSGSNLNSVLAASQAEQQEKMD